MSQRKKKEIKNNSLPHHSSQSVSRSSQVACLTAHIAAQLALRLLIYLLSLPNRAKAPFVEERLI